MTFRTRILLASLVVALTPLLLFVLGARWEVRRRLEAQNKVRVTASALAIVQGLETERAALNARLAALAERIADDASQRAALLGHTDRAVILNYAASVMPVAGLDYLLLLDSTGTVLSSGHFRNDYDRRVTALPVLLAAKDAVLINTRRPQAEFLALVRARNFELGGQRFSLVGGFEVDSLFLRRLVRADSTVVVSLEYPGGALFSDTPISGGAERQRVPLPFIDDLNARGLAEAHWNIAHSSAGLRSLQRGLDTWLVVGVIAAIVLALLIAQWLAARVNQPIEELAGQAERVNLERIDVGFATDRTDEIGSLARLLDAMVKRLRAGANQLRDAERRATVGDMARQVNHDIRNGLLPIRNVIRHLGEVARETPAELNTVFSEREETLQGGIGYLESLASNYARLTPRSERRACDVNAIVRAAFGEGPANRARVQLDLSDASPRVLADPVALRRTIENLVVNALESLPNGTGTVTAKTWIEKIGDQRRVIITVADNGVGIEPAALERIFDDFYTTKEHGSGLGLSIVRRLVADMDGRIRVQSERGQGTTFRVELPEAR